MSMLDSLRSKLGIDPDADSYVDDTEENVFPGGQGAAAAQEYNQQQEIKQHSNKVVNINATSRPTPGRKNRWPTCNAPLTGISCRPTGIISVRFWALALSAAAWGTCWQTPSVRTHFTR